MHGHIMTRLDKIQGALAEQIPGNGVRHLDNLLSGGFFPKFVAVSFEVVEGE